LLYEIDDSLFLSDLVAALFPPETAGAEYLMHASR
jgi:hypothetical protein